MNPTVHAARLGLARGWVETRHSLTNPQDLGWNLFVVTVFVVVLLFQRNAKVEGSALPLAMLTLPSILGTWVAVGGYTGAAGALAVEREDGTLLRAKAVPQGMAGYLVGRIVSLSLITLSTLVIIFVAGLLVLPDLATAGGSGWPTLVWVVALGLLATLPWGAVIGSLVKTPNSALGLTMLPVIVLTAISGIFYPIAALPGWVQGVAQVFPIYWLLARARHPLGPAAGRRRRPGDLGIVAAPGDRRRARRVGAGGSADRTRGAAPHGAPRVGLHRGGPPATAPATHPLMP